MTNVDAFSLGITARKYARKMVELESRGNGDQLNAMERVGSDCGMTARSIRRLINGETKDPGVSVFARIYQAYLDLCERHIEKLTRELEDSKQGISDAAFADFDSEIASLRQRLNAAKERI